jgi:hypothetical protein
MAIRLTEPDDLPRLTSADFDSFKHCRPAGSQPAATAFAARLQLGGTLREIVVGHEPVLPTANTQGDVRLKSARCRTDLSERPDSTDLRGTIRRWVSSA